MRKYSKLTELMFKHITAPPNSANSEKLFSTACSIYTENRNRLTLENAEKLLFNTENI